MPLTEQQKLYLELIAEEAAEVIHIKSKIIRFGLDDEYSDKGTNKERLEEEIGHFMATLVLLREEGIINLKSCQNQTLEKLTEWRVKTNVAKR